MRDLANRKYQWTYTKEKYIQEEKNNKYREMELKIKNENAD